jgi:hypothetical protein
MLETVVALQNKLNLSGADRRAMWTRYCGTATEKNVDVAALSDMAAALREKGAA